MWKTVKGPLTQWLGPLLSHLEGTLNFLCSKIEEMNGIKEFVIGLYDDIFRIQLLWNSFNSDIVF